MDLNKINASGKLVGITKHTMKTVNDLLNGDLIEDFDQLSEMGSKKHFDSAYIVFSNNNQDQRQPTTTNFRVEMMMRGSHSPGPFLEMMMKNTPWVSFRVLSIFEGKLDSFIEYPPLESLED